MPAKNTKKQPEPDWEAIAKPYIQGVLSLDKICKRFSTNKMKISKSRLSYQMKKRGYHTLRLQSREKLKANPLPDKKPEPSQESQEIAKSTTNDLQKIVEDELLGFKELKDMSKIMMENMSRALNSVIESNGDAEKVIAPAFLGGRETVADYLKKLTDIYSKTVQMERVCLGLDKETPEDEEKSYEDRLKELHEEQPALSDDSNNVIDGEFTEVKEAKN